MLDVLNFKASDLSSLSVKKVAALAEQMLCHISEQSQQIEERDQRIAERDQRIASQARDIKFKDVKLERITFELARLKAWKFGAKTERMSAEQRHLFEEALAEDQASLEAQLAALLGEARHKAANADSDADDEKTKRSPRRQALPEHLRRVEYQHEPDSTTCPSPGCGQAMVRIGEDITEKLDIVPAEFFVRRHVRGKWACRCCQVLVQPPVEPQVIDKGMPAAGLVAHTLVSRFVDHLPYYRQETINARSRVHTPLGISEERDRCFRHRDRRFRECDRSFR